MSSTLAMSDRMFRVIVAGGIALVSAAPTALVSCGSSDTTSTSSQGQDDASGDGFPSEGPMAADGTGGGGDSARGDGALSDQTSDGPGQPDGFPKEGPALSDF